MNAKGLVQMDRNMFHGIVFYEALHYRYDYDELFGVVLAKNQFINNIILITFVIWYS